MLLGLILAASERPLGGTTKRIDPLRRLGGIAGRLGHGIKTAWPVVSGSTKGVVKWCTVEQQEGNNGVSKVSQQVTQHGRTSCGHHLLVINGPSSRWIKRVVPAGAQGRCREYRSREGPCGQCGGALDTPDSRFEGSLRSLRVCSHLW